MIDCFDFRQFEFWTSSIFIDIREEIRGKNRLSVVNRALSIQLAYNKMYS